MGFIKHIIRKVEEVTGEGFGTLVSPYNATANVMSANNQTEKEKSIILPLWAQIILMSMAVVVVVMPVIPIVNGLYKIYFYPGDSKNEPSKGFLSSCQKYSKIDEKSREEDINISISNLQSTDHDSGDYDGLSIISQARYNHPEVTSHIGYNLQSNSGTLDHSNGEESLINSISKNQELLLMGLNIGDSIWRTL